jgi:hypothetical protein
VNYQEWPLEIERRPVEKFNDESRPPRPLIRKTRECDDMKSPLLLRKCERWIFLLSQVRLVRSAGKTGRLMPSSAVLTLRKPVRSRD